MGFHGPPAGVRILTTGPGEGRGGAARLASGARQAAGVRLLEQPPRLRPYAKVSRSGEGPGVRRLPTLHEALEKTIVTVLAGLRGQAH